MFGKVAFPTTAIYSWRTIKEATGIRVQRAQDRAQDIVRKLYLAYAEVDGAKRRVLDKTPRYYLIAEELLRVFPNSKILVITRDINDIVNSIRNTWGDGQLKLTHAWLDLRLGPRLLDSFMNAHLNDDRVSTISYEDLQLDPARVERKLQQFLDLPAIDFSQLRHSSLDGPLGDASKRNSTRIEPPAGRRRVSLVQHLLVKYAFARGVANCWTQRPPELSYRPLSNVMDLFWIAASFIAVTLKFSQLRATMKYPYNWS
jgi:hypothetical protein